MTRRCSLDFTFVASLIITAIRLGPQLLQGRDKARSAVRGSGSAFLFFLAKLLLGIPLVDFATLTLSSLGTQELPCFKSMLYSPAILFFCTGPIRIRNCAAQPV